MILFEDKMANNSLNFQDISLNLIISRFVFVFKIMKFLKLPSNLSQRKRSTFPFNIRKIILFYKQSSLFK